MSVTTKKIALVTGANKGIGKETARQLAELGYTVYLGARDAARGQSAAEELSAAGGDVRFVRLDVTEPETLRSAAEQVAAEAGRLDALVNNAGIATDQAPPSTADLDSVRSTYEVNFYGPVAVTQAFLPLLRAGSEKVIVNVSSELASIALNGDPDAQFAAVNILGYNSSKPALNAFTVMLAKELAPEGFRVNAVDPGFTATDMNGHAGPLSPEDAARIVVRNATLDTDGPTGGFFTEGGTLPW
jgi:NAD(P)-dependent dehydrogenase (short-subunit alcohol dehydrogenase family)